MQCLTFDDKAKREAFVRQSGICAVCGCSLNELAMNTDLHVNYHHVVPAHLGGGRDADNCVVVCSADLRGSGHLSCHYRVHQNGRTGSGFVAPPDYFRYSHGRSLVQHERWVARMNRRFKGLE